LLTLLHINVQNTLALLTALHHRMFSPLFFFSAFHILIHSLLVSFYICRTMTNRYSGVLTWHGTNYQWLHFDLWPPTPLRNWFAGHCTLCYATNTNATLHQHAERCSNYDGVDALELDIFVAFTPSQWRRFEARSAAFIASLYALSIRCVTCNAQLTSTADLTRHFATHDRPPATPPLALARTRARRPLRTRLLTPPPSHARQHNALPAYSEDLSSPTMLLPIPLPSYDETVLHATYVTDLLLDTTQHLLWLIHLFLDYGTGTHTHLLPDDMAF